MNIPINTILLLYKYLFALYFSQIFLQIKHLIQNVVCLRDSLES